MACDIRSSSLNSSLRCTTARLRVRGRLLLQPSEHFHALPRRHVRQRHGRPQPRARVRAVRAGVHMRVRGHDVRVARALRARLLLPARRERRHGVRLGALQRVARPGRRERVQGLPGGLVVRRGHGELDRRLLPGRLLLPVRHRLVRTRARIDPPLSRHPTRSLYDIIQSITRRVRSAASLLATTRFRARRASQNRAQPGHLHPPGTRTRRARRARTRARAPASPTRRSASTARSATTARRRRRSRPRAGAARTSRTPAWATRRTAATAMRAGRARRARSRRRACRATPATTVPPARRPRARTRARPARSRTGAGRTVVTPRGEDARRS